MIIPLICCWGEIREPFDAPQHSGLTLSLAKSSIGSSVGGEGWETMAFFDRMTNQSFGRSENGAAVYLPVLKLGRARLLPSARDEAMMRHVVTNIYRYTVLVVCPIIVMGQFYLRLDGDIDLGELVILALLTMGLLCPAAIIPAYLGRSFEAVDLRAVKIQEIDTGTGPTLGAALVLSAFTLCIAILASMAIYGSIAH
jgi:hypothetical protein